MIAEEIGPGFWRDERGVTHVSLKQLVNYLDWPDTEQSYELLTDAILELVKSDKIAVEVKELCPVCGRVMFG